MGNMTIKDIADQRLFRQHDLPCDQRSPGCPAETKERVLR